MAYGSVFTADPLPNRRAVRLGGILPREMARIEFNDPDVSELTSENVRVRRRDERIVTPVQHEEGRWNRRQ